MNGPVVSAKIGNLQIMGGPIADVSAVVAGMAADIRLCLKNAVQADPTAVKTGSQLTVVASIDRSGVVTSSTAMSVMGIPATAASCITQRVAAARFAPPDSGTSQLQLSVTAHVQ